MDHTPTHRTSKDISAFTQKHDTYLYWVKKILVYCTKKVFLNAGGKEVVDSGK